MLQYYLRAAGLSLSWVGTGRFIFSHNYTDDDFAEVAERIVPFLQSRLEAPETLIDHMSLVFGAALLGESEHIAQSRIWARRAGGRACRRGARRP